MRYCCWRPCRSINVDVRSEAGWRVPAILFAVQIGASAFAVVGTSPGCNAITGIGDFVVLEQGTCVAAAGADAVAWSRHLEEFGLVRRASLAFVGNLPAAAWERTGVASDCPFSVRALVYLLPGHVAHHLAGIRANYLGTGPGP